MRYKALMLFSIISFACTACAQHNPVDVREKMYNSFIKHGYFGNKSHPIHHFVHICNLVIDNKQYGVIQIRKEIDQPESRLILITDNSLKVVNEIAVTNQRPMFCFDNHILWYGYFDHSKNHKDVNVFSFIDNGRNYLVGWEDPANFPSFIKGHWSHQ